MSDTFLFCNALKVYTYLLLYSYIIFIIFITVLWYMVHVDWTVNSLARKGGGEGGRRTPLELNLSVVIHVVDIVE
jgi:hypothetical protein